MGDIVGGGRSRGRVAGVQRVSVVGSSGSGKTTEARRLAAALGVPHVELDALHWGPHWRAASGQELAERVEAETAGEAWVVDGNDTSKVGSQVWDKADTVVWVSPPRWRATWQVVRRTVGRAALRRELWSGNREGWITFHRLRSRRDVERFLDDVRRSHRGPTP